MPYHRTSAASKQLRGSFRADRYSAPTGEALTRSPQVPSDLSKDAKKLWREIAPVLAQKRVLTEGDLAALKLLCSSLSLEQVARETIEREGLTVDSVQGVRAHPATRICQQARSEASRLLVEFGMTPRARQNVEAVPEPRPVDPAEKFFQ